MKEGRKRKSFGYKDGVGWVYSNKSSRWEYDPYASSTNHGKTGTRNKTGIYVKLSSL